MTRIVKNFLPADHFRAMEQLFMSDLIPWHYNDRVVSTTPQFMFTHTFMNDGKVVNAQWLEPVRAMLPAMQEIRPFIGVARIKANLYTNQGKAIEHPVHHDLPPGHPDSDRFFVAVFHVNTCNGRTVIGDRAIESEANQLIVFDNVAHHGTVQTDTDTRVVINFNLRAPD